MAHHASLARDVKAAGLKPKPEVGIQLGAGGDTSALELASQGQARPGTGRWLGEERLRSESERERERESESETAEAGRHGRHRHAGTADELPMRQLMQLACAGLSMLNGQVDPRWAIRRAKACLEAGAEIVMVESEGEGMGARGHRL